MSTPVLQRSPTEREVLAAKIAERLDRPVAALGVVALAMWLLEPVTNSSSFNMVFDIAVVVIAVAFIGEFAVRTVVAPDTWRFLRNRWWEVGLIVTPFLRFIRVFRAGQAARGIATAVKSSQEAGAKLRNRLLFLVLITAVVACAAGRLLWQFGGYKDDYAEAVHDAAMSTLTGAELGSRGAFAQVLEIVLAVYSVVIVAAIAAALADFFLGRTTAVPWAREDGPTSPAEGTTSGVR